MKRNESIVSISREHHFALLFCWKVRTGIKAGISYIRIRDYIAYFWKHILQPHFEQEETCLFIHRADDLVQKALADHRQLKEMVMQMLSQSEENNDDPGKLAGMVDSHIRFEERMLFPHLERTLSDTEMKSIGRSLAMCDIPLKDEYTDEFWVIKEKDATTK